jgi:hypothetical protein
MVAGTAGTPRQGGRRRNDQACDRRGRRPHQGSRRLNDQVVVLGEKAVVVAS